jgi:RNA polymerase sigma-70 factor (ECF subfamily)
MKASDAEAVNHIAGLGRWAPGDLLNSPAAVKISADGFERWMIAEQRRVYLLCLRMLRSCDEADSATQDTFLKAFRVLEHQRRLEVNDPARWISRIAINTCLDRLRARQFRFWKRRITRIDEEAILRLTPASGLSQEEVLVSRDMGRRLAAALDRLSPRQRLVFLLRHEESCSLEEIGEILGLDSGTVKSHMARAVSKLRGELRDLYGKPALER